MAQRENREEKEEARAGRAQGTRVAAVGVLQHRVRPQAACRKGALLHPLQLGHNCSYLQIVGRQKLNADDSIAWSTDLKSSTARTWIRG